MFDRGEISASKVTFLKSSFQPLLAEELFDSNPPPLLVKPPGGSKTTDWSFDKQLMRRYLRDSLSLIDPARHLIHLSLVVEVDRWYKPFGIKC